MGAMKGIVLAVAGVSSLVVATIVTAGPLEDQAIKARRGYYQMMLWDLDPLEAMLKGDTPWNAAAARRHAQGMASLADFEVDRLFTPKSSIDDKKGNTRALPAIWNERARFTRLNAEWQAQARALLAAADRGREPFNAELVKLGETCAACHNSFRAKEF